MTNRSGPISELTQSVGRDHHGHLLPPRRDDQWYDALADIDPWMPTNAPAGSLQKVRVLAKRMMDGAPLWHPLDAVEMTREPRNLLSLPWHRGGCETVVDDGDEGYDDEDI